MLSDGNSVAVGSELLVGSVAFDTWSDWGVSVRSVPTVSVTECDVVFRSVDTVCSGVNSSVSTVSVMLSGGNSARLPSELLVGSVAFDTWSDWGVSVRSVPTVSSPECDVVFRSVDTVCSGVNSSVSTVSVMLSGGNSVVVGSELLVGSVAFDTWSDWGVSVRSVPTVSVISCVVDSFFTVVVVSVAGAGVDELSNTSVGVLHSSVDCVASVSVCSGVNSSVSTVSVMLSGGNPVVVGSELLVGSVAFDTWSDWGVSVRSVPTVSVISCVVDSFFTVVGVSVAGAGVDELSNTSVGVLHSSVDCVASVSVCSGVNSSVSTVSVMLSGGNSVVVGSELLVGSVAFDTWSDWGVSVRSVPTVSVISCVVDSFFTVVVVSVAGAGVDELSNTSVGVLHSSVDCVASVSVCSGVNSSVSTVSVMLSGGNSVVVGSELLVGSVAFDTWSDWGVSVRSVPTVSVISCVVDSFFTVVVVSVAGAGVDELSNTSVGVLHSSVDCVASVSVCSGVNSSVSTVSVMLSGGNSVVVGSELLVGSVAFDTWSDWGVSVRSVPTVSVISCVVDSFFTVVVVSVAGAGVDELSNTSVGVLHSSVDCVASVSVCSGVNSSVSTVSVMLSGGNSVVVGSELLVGSVAFDTWSDWGVSVRSVPTVSVISCVVDSFFTVVVVSVAGAGVDELSNTSVGVLHSSVDCVASVSVCSGVNSSVSTVSVMLSGGNSVVVGSELLVGSVAFDTWSDWGVSVRSVPTVSVISCVVDSFFTVVVVSVAGAGVDELSNTSVGVLHSSVDCVASVSVCSGVNSSVSTVSVMLSGGNSVVVGSELLVGSVAFDTWSDWGVSVRSVPTVSVISCVVDSFFTVVVVSVAGAGVDELSNTSVGVLHSSVDCVASVSVCSGVNSSVSTVSVMLSGGNSVVVGSELLVGSVAFDTWSDWGVSVRSVPTVSVISCVVDSFFTVVVVSVAGAGVDELSNTSVGVLHSSVDCVASVSVCSGVNSSVSTVSVMLSGGNSVVVGSELLVGSVAFDTWSDWGVSVRSVPTVSVISCVVDSFFTVVVVSVAGAGVDELSNTSVGVLHSSVDCVASVSVCSGVNSSVSTVSVMLSGGNSVVVGSELLVGSVAFDTWSDWGVSVRSVPTVSVISCVVDSFFTVVVVSVAGAGVDELSNTSVGVLHSSVDCVASVSVCSGVNSSVSTVSVMLSGGNSVVVGSELLVGSVAFDTWSDWGVSVRSVPTVSVISCVVDSFFTVVVVSVAGAGVDELSNTSVGVLHSSVDCVASVSVCSGVNSSVSTVSVMLSGGNSVVVGSELLVGSVAFDTWSDWGVSVRSVPTVSVISCVVDSFFTVVVVSVAGAGVDELSNTSVGVLHSSVDCVASVSVCSGVNSSVSTVSVMLSGGNSVVVGSELLVGSVAFDTWSDWGVSVRSVPTVSVISCVVDSFFTVVVVSVAGAGVDELSNTSVGVLHSSVDCVASVSVCSGVNSSVSTVSVMLSGGNSVVVGSELLVGSVAFDTWSDWGVSVRSVPTVSVISCVVDSFFTVVVVSVAGAGVDELSNTSVGVLHSSVDCVASVSVCSGVNSSVSTVSVMLSGGNSVVVGSELLVGSVAFDTWSDWGVSVRSVPTVSVISCVVDSFFTVVVVSVAGAGVDELSNTSVGVLHSSVDCVASVSVCSGVNSSVSTVSVMLSGGNSVVVGSELLVGSVAFDTWSDWGVSVRSVPTVSVISCVVDSFFTVVVVSVAGAGVDELSNTSVGVLHSSVDCVASVSVCSGVNSSVSTVSVMLSGGNSVVVGSELLVGSVAFDTWSDWGVSVRSVPTVSVISCVVDSFFTVVVVSVAGAGVDELSNTSVGVLHSSVDCVASVSVCSGVNSSVSTVSVMLSGGNSVVVGSELLVGSVAFDTWSDWGVSVRSVPTVSVISCVVDSFFTVVVVSVAGAGVDELSNTSVGVLHSSVDCVASVSVCSGVNSSVSTVSVMLSGGNSVVVGSELLVGSVAFDTWSDWGVSVRSVPTVSVISCVVDSFFTVVVVSVAGAGVDELSNTSVGVLHSSVDCVASVSVCSGVNSSVSTVSVMLSGGNSVVVGSELLVGSVAFDTWSDWGVSVRSVPTVSVISCVVDSFFTVVVVSVAGAGVDELSNTSVGVLHSSVDCVASVSVCSGVNSSVSTVSVMLSGGNSVVVGSELLVGSVAFDTWSDWGVSVRSVPTVSVISCVVDSFFTVVVVSVAGAGVDELSNTSVGVLHSSVDCVASVSVCSGVNSSVSTVSVMLSGGNSVVVGSELLVGSVAFDTWSDWGVSVRSVPTVSVISCVVDSFFTVVVVSVAGAGVDELSNTSVGVLHSSVDCVASVSVCSGVNSSVSTVSVMLSGGNSVVVGSELLVGSVAFDTWSDWGVSVRSVPTVSVISCVVDSFFTVVVVSVAGAGVDELSNTSVGVLHSSVDCVASVSVCSGVNSSVSTVSVMLSGGNSVVVGSELLVGSVAFDTWSDWGVSVRSVPTVSVISCVVDSFFTVVVVSVAGAGVDELSNTSVGVLHSSVDCVASVSVCSGVNSSVSTVSVMLSGGNSVVVGSELLVGSVAFDTWSDWGVSVRSVPTVSVISCVVDSFFTVVVVSVAGAGVDELSNTSVGVLHSSVDCVASVSVCSGVNSSVSTVSVMLSGGNSVVVGSELLVGSVAFDTWSDWGVSVRSVPTVSVISCVVDSFFTVVVVSVAGAGVDELSNTSVGVLHSSVDCVASVSVCSGVNSSVSTVSVMLSGGNSVVVGSELLVGSVAFDTWSDWGVSVRSVPTVSVISCVVDSFFTVVVVSVAGAGVDELSNTSVGVLHSSVDCVASVSVCSGVNSSVSTVSVMLSGGNSVVVGSELLVGSVAFDTWSDWGVSVRSVPTVSVISCVVDSFFTVVVVSVAGAGVDELSNTSVGVLHSSVDCVASVSVCSGVNSSVSTVSVMLSGGNSVVVDAERMVVSLPGIPSVLCVLWR
ncbi:hypothetical protein T265_03678 [Opisthorchis viverrini]|uniref:Uncharacterized protein n=1 Tax=Opisthorchis viverrini TaxID=6198 RepID=A0A074ZQS9_OPIVI|nr:hypothetical protein T265_03678 [Opisthorchis viverrini]KER29768.1 hypothetical protein T265_03678 [Opisthorchis viverrini]